ncbi:hypothetical protein SAMN05444411_102314 [Lutibacter oricola]|uniref:Uncharacterized protein n=1 Tax=Lutibacter oricola TaxID=762486 RepID=A0A1H2WXS4_9FLAO|nr:hypothetical protein [Lutibacter oricola]SDW85412.1 hypothetical protein SAMN05444411_102314 [Lutibacter oricola]
MNIKDITGSFNIIGNNQDASGNNYKGTLTLKLDLNNRIQATWLISNSQEQIGSGFFKENILVINFSYQGEDNEPYYGVVVYKCLSPDILEGFWSEEFGDPKFLGEEKCFRIKDENQLLN